MRRARPVRGLAEQAEDDGNDNPNKQKGEGQAKEAAQSGDEAEDGEEEGALRDVLEQTSLLGTASKSCLFTNSHAC